MLATIFPLVSCIKYEPFLRKTFIRNTQSHNHNFDVRSLAHCVTFKKHCVLRLVLCAEKRVYKNVLFTIRIVFIIIIFFYFLYLFDNFFCLSNGHSFSRRSTRNKLLVCVSCYIICSCVCFLPSLPLFPSFSHAQSKWNHVVFIEKRTKNETRESRNGQTVIVNNANKNSFN